MDRNHEHIEKGPELETKNPWAEIVREEWTSSSTIEAWRRWYNKMVSQTQPLTQAILDLAELKPGLDSASGTGDPPPRGEV